MKRSLIICLILLSGITARAEKPYFQQKINYRINVDLDPETSTLAGSESILYFNNSPDSLKEIYFHLYYNAFQPGSYMEIVGRKRHYYRQVFSNPKSMGYDKIDRIKINGIETTDYQIDNTIMKTPLKTPIAPGDSLYFYIEFRAQIPARGSRTARRGEHFDVGQWFPKPAVYDRYGWHVHQYLLEGEFYADFGNFDVEISLPPKYIVAHTGELLNEEEIFGRKLPVPEGDSILIDALAFYKSDSLSIKNKDSLAASLNLKQLLAADSLPSPLNPNDTLNLVDSSKTGIDTVSMAKNLKTWKIRAENIHDFAFSADPEFIVDICRYNNTIIKSYYTKSTKDRWQFKAADQTRKAIKLFSEKYYAYPYRQFSNVASLVDGGMEYPQLVMISGHYGENNKYDRGLESTIAHEVAHNWFYGLLGFNETEQAYLDEGMASFATIQYMENYHGRFANDYSYDKKWQKLLLPNSNERDENYKTYIENAIVGEEDPLLTPADQYADAGRYFVASYQKASAVYFMLQYTIGTEKFDQMMKSFCGKWAYKHPYLSDFQNMADSTNGQSLEWFFRQWFTTTWTLDYGISRLHYEKAIVEKQQGYMTDFTLMNNSRCLSPLDVELYFKDGSIDTVEIAESVWEKGQINYDTSIFFPTKPYKAILNPDLRLADINRLDNYSGIPKIHWQFVVPKFIYRHNEVQDYVESYTISHKPNFWYNSVDGLKIGYHLKGSYLDISKKLALNLEYGLQSNKTDYEVSYEDRFYSFNPQLHYYGRSRELEGRGQHEIGIKYGYDSYFNAGTVADLSLKRTYLYSSKYISGHPWSKGSVNTFDLSVGRSMEVKSTEIILQASMSTSAPGSNYDFTRMAFGAQFNIYDSFSGQSSILFKAGRADGNVPFQRRFFLSSADPYDTWDAPLYRSRGTLPEKAINNGHLFLPGGAGLYGYYDRKISGNKLIAVNVLKDLPEFNLPYSIPILSGEIAKIQTQIYLNGGHTWDSGTKFKTNNMLWESGLIFKYRIPYLDLFMDQSRMSLYLPLWISNPANGEHNFKWRWLISITG